MVLGIGRAVVLAGGNFGQVKVLRLLCAGAVDVHATDHFIPGAARPFPGIALGAEVLIFGDQPRLRMTTFRVFEGVLLIVATVSSGTGVPEVYRMTWG